MRRICTVNWKIHKLLTQVFCHLVWEIFNYLRHHVTLPKRAECNHFSFSHYYYQSNSRKNFVFFCFLQLGKTTCLNILWGIGHDYSCRDTLCRTWWKKIKPQKYHFSALFFCQEYGFLRCLGMFTKPEHHILKVSNKSLNLNGLQPEQVII